MAIKQRGRATGTVLTPTAPEAPVLRPLDVARQASHALLQAADNYSGPLNEEGLARMQEFRGQLKAHLQSLETERVAAGDPHRRALAKVDTDYGRETTPVLKALDRLDEQMRTYRRAQQPPKS